MSNAINFCHISPVSGLQTYTQHNGAHLILAHLVEENHEYASYYASLQDEKYSIMDNSAFEMFKQGKPMYDPDNLLQMAEKCAADCIVMSDYPKQHYSVTIEAAKTQMFVFEDAGYDTFFVPQSELGDMDGLLTSIKWALDQPSITLIGLSILSCPIACGVNESTFSDGKRSDAYKMQRYLSRLEVFRRMEKAGLLNDNCFGRFHCLGMVDGPKEIDLLRDYHPFIYSWDSSAAVWAGMHGIRFDNSPTGLMNGKFEKEVEFDADIEHNQLDVMYNIKYINKLCGI